MNVVFILSDQHNAFFTGYRGHPLAETPAMDRLAAEGVRFDTTYTCSPLCSPARAALFTGRYIFENGCWDNVTAWDGRMKGWPHFFRDNGVSLVTVGKLDFEPGVDHGIEREILAKHRGSKDIHSLFRRDTSCPPRWTKKRQMDGVGPREDAGFEKTGDYEVAERAIEWLENERPHEKPWILNVNFSNPHPGWALPPDDWEKWNALVSFEALPEKYSEPPENLHPYMRNFAHHQCGLYATKEEIRRGQAGYLGRIEFTDRYIGMVTEALERLGLLDDTLIIYSSDHGENAGAHRMWGKMNAYEDSLRVPLIMSAPGLDKGTVVKSPVSHLDIFPTIAEAVGLEATPDFRGISLLPAARREKDAPANDYVMSEFHANGAPAAIFAVSDGRWKYVECVGERPMLFDLDNDPQELRDLVVEDSTQPEVRKIIKRFHAWLCNLCSPQGVDTHAARDQEIVLERMAAAGTLVEEMYKRGYERRTDRLVVREEFIPGKFKGDAAMKGLAE